MARMTDPETELLDAAATRAWLARWDEVAAVTIAEARALTPAEKIEHLQSLMESASLFDRTAAMEQEDERVRALWMRLHGLVRW